jgi:hypothetical protein
LQRFGRLTSCVKLVDVGRRHLGGGRHGASKGEQSLIALQKFSRFSPSTLSYNETH